MPDVFISYAREDRAYAQRIAKALEDKGFSVWWDWDLVGGSNYRSEIRKVIRDTRKALVLWSQHSVNSAFVIDEATEARKLGKLVPVLIDDADLPFGFGDLHTIPLPDPGVDVEPVVAALQGRPQSRAAAPAAKTRFDWRIAAALASIVLLTAGGFAYWQFGTPKPAPAPAIAATETMPRPVQPAAGPRLALVIGNADYRELPKLINAVRDADVVADALMARGFNVIKETNIDRERMISVFSDFERSLAINGGVGVFYYAGQAVYVEGEDIMFPVDTRSASDRSVLREGVNLTRLQKEIQSRTLRTWQDNGIVTIYSASKGQTASDGPAGRNSPFTTAFVGALSQRSDDLNDLFQRVRHDVETSPTSVTPTKQTPDISGQLREKFFFNQPARDPATRVSRILIFDACRDDPFDTVATRSSR